MFVSAHRSSMKRTFYGSLIATQFRSSVHLTLEFVRSFCGRFPRTVYRSMASRGEHSNSSTRRSSVRRNDSVDRIAQFYSVRTWNSFKSTDETDRRSARWGSDCARVAVHGCVRRERRERTTETIAPKCYVFCEPNGTAAAAASATRPYQFCCFASFSFPVSISRRRMWRTR